jgi:hypothetical protein
MTEISAALLAAAASVCGYHDGPDCEHCREAITYQLERGRSEDDIVADMTLYRDDFPAWYAQRVAAAQKTAWRGLSGPFTCTSCGKHVIYDSGGAQQTIDGSQEQCRNCVQDRVDAAWAAKPDGVYAVNVRDVDGAVLATDYIRKGDASDG